MVKQKNPKKTNLTNENVGNSAPTTVTTNSVTNGSVPNTSATNFPVAPSRSATSTNNRHSNQPRRDREKSSSSGSQNHLNYRDRKNNEKQESSNSAREKEKKDKDRSSNTINGTSTLNRKDKNRDNSSQSRRSGSTTGSTKGASSSTALSTTPTTSSEVKKEETSGTGGSGPQLSPINETNQAMFVKQTTGKKRASLMKRHANMRVTDTLLAFLEHTEWDKVDLMCEILCMLNAIDLRLVGNCVEGLARNHTHQMKPVEKCANSDNPINVFPLHFGQHDLPNNEDGSATSTSSSSNNKSPESGSTSCSSPENAPNGMENLDKESPDEAFQRISSLLNTLYAVIAVLSSTNRRSACQISSYVDGILMNGRPNYFRILQDPIQKMVILQMIGKIVSACVHHPAFSSVDRIRYAKARDALRCEFEAMHKRFGEEQRKDVQLRHEKLGVANTMDDSENEENELEEEDEEADDEGVPPIISEHHPYYSASAANNESPYNVRNSSGRFIYVERFVATHIPANNEVSESFQITIQWSDNEETYVNRTRDELWSLHHKLLDKFGNLRTEKAPGNGGESASEDAQIKVSSSTTTIDGFQPKSGTRILPMLKKDAQPNDIVYYINSLSDLPAKIILSDIIAEEFGPTRRTSLDEDESADGIILPRCGIRLPRVSKLEGAENPAPSISPNLSTYAMPIVPLIYSTIPPGHFQIYEKSCSNCGGNHLFQNCEKPNILERKNEYKLDFEEPSSLNACHISQPNGTSGLAPPPGLHLPNMANGHFAFHQHQHQQHQQFFNTNGQQPQYRLLGPGQPFEYAPGPYLFPTAQQQQQQQQQQQNGNF